MVMPFGTKRKLENNKFSIKLYGNNLQCVEKMKYLGVILDSQLTWSEHIKHISIKISRSIGCIRRIKHLIPHKTLITLYFALILPHIDYCCTAWGSCSKTNLSKLQKLQNRYARLILNKNYDTPQCTLLTTLNWQSVEQRLKYHYCLLVFKIINTMAPKYLKSLITHRTFNYCTRYSLNSLLDIPFPKTEFKKKIILV